MRLFYCPRNDYFRTASDSTVFECEKEQGLRANSAKLKQVSQSLLEALSDTQHPASWNDIDPRLAPCGDVERFCRLAAFYQKNEGTIPGPTMRGTGSGSSSVDSSNSSGAAGFGERRRGRKGGKNQAMTFDDAINRETKK